MTISYAITANNEHKELERLLDQLFQHKRPQDEIIVQLDTTATDEVKKSLDKYYPDIACIVTKDLNKDFATFKNNLFDYCKNDYIVFLDADEFVSVDFMNYLPEILKNNPDVDLYNVPRWNYVEGLTQKHIQKWGWKVDELERINWPDLQSRVCKNIDSIRWRGKVHERLQGFKQIATLPEVLYIYHPKHISKQEQQNKLYDSI